MLDCELTTDIFLLISKLTLKSQCPDLQESSSLLNFGAVWIKFLRPERLGPESEKGETFRADYQMKYWQSSFLQTR